MRNSAVGEVPSLQMQQYYPQSPQKSPAVPPRSSPCRAAGCAELQQQRRLDYSTRRHSVACTSPAMQMLHTNPASSPTSQMQLLNNTNTMNDSVFYEDDYYSNSSGASAASSPLTHRKAERSHSEPKAPTALYRELSEDRLGLAKNRYKTELCRAFLEAGHCKYGEKCQFAHGKGDMRSVNRHPKYKTENCRSFHATGLCQYGARCHFIHHPSEAYMGLPPMADDAGGAASRTRSVSLCAYGAGGQQQQVQSVPQLHIRAFVEQSYAPGSCGDSSGGGGFSSYSSSPLSMSPGLQGGSWPTDSYFGGSTSSVGSCVGLVDEPYSPWMRSVDLLLYDI